MRAFRLRFRTLVVLLLALSLVATACGGDDDDDVAADDDGTTTTAAGEEAAPALSGDPIKIGVLLTQSGPAASIGQILKVPIDFWLSENEATGIDGHPIEIIYKDDGGTAATAATAARELIDSDQVDVVVGPAISDASSAALPLLMDAKISTAILSAFQPAHDPAEFPYVYPLEFGSGHQAVSFLRALEESDASKVGYIAPNNTLGNAQLGILEGQAGAAGVDLVDSQFYEPGATDVTTQVQNLRSSGAEAIVIGDVVQPVIVTILDAIVTLGWDDVRIVGLSPLADYFVVDAADPDVLSRGIATGFTPNTLNPLPADVADWRDRFAEFLGEDDIGRRLYQSLRPYEALDLLTYLIEETGGTDADAHKAFIEGEGGWEGLSGQYVYTSDVHEGLEDDVSGNPGTYDNGAYDPIG